MNAGPDVERLIADWLTEEAPTRAPDRILRAAATRIDHTRRPRFAAAWRNPMPSSIPRLLAGLAVVVAVGVGAAWIGRSTADIGGAAPAAPTPLTVEAYRAARNAICTPAYATEAGLLKSVDGVFLTQLSEPQRAAKTADLEQIAIVIGQADTDLQKIAAPPEIASDHAADIARREDTRARIVQTVALLRAGKLPEAGAMDRSTDAISRQIEIFEKYWSLAPCP